MSGRRLDVTATQAVSSMLAALTGAIAASGLGIAGTIIGAAFMSLAGTVGAAIYKHYLGRSREKLREAATSLETSEVAFFAEDALPELSIARVTEAQIRRMFEHRRRPELPADFD